MFLAIKNGFLVAIILFFTQISFINSAYIKVLGAGIGGTSTGGSGYYLPAPIINFSFFSHNRFAYSINTDILGIYGLGLNPMANIDKIIDKNDKSKDSEKLRKILDAAKGLSTFSASTLNVEYDLFDKRGFYTFAGLGYGLQISVKNEGVSLVKTISALVDNDIFKNTSSSSTDFESLLKDEEFKNNLIKSINGLVSVVKTVLPEANGLINQVNVLVNDPNIVKDEARLDAWLNDLKTEYEKLENVDFEKALDDKLTDVAKDNLLNINRGIAYTFGVGYDLKILGPLGLDINAKVSGLFAKPFIPVYTTGVSLIFKW